MHIKTNDTRYRGATTENLKRLFLILKLLLLTLPMLGSDCGPGLSYEYDLASAERQFAPQ